MIPRSLAERFVFVDTSAFFAAADRRDRSHAEAAQAFELVERERAPLFTSNLVVAETYVLMRKRLGPTLPVRWLRSLELNLVFESEADHSKAIAILARYRDKDFSYADAVSFVLMERLGIQTALTFDTHFRQYGLTVLP